VTIACPTAASSRTGCSPGRLPGRTRQSRATDAEAFLGKSSLRLDANGPGGFFQGSVSAGDLALAPGSLYKLEFAYRLTAPGQAIIARIANPEGEPQIYVEARGGGATPGRPSSVLAARPPPFLPAGGHSPLIVKPDAEVVLTATASILKKPGVVEAHWDDGSGERTKTLVDDGAHGDGAAADGVYGASINRFPAGTLVRYWFTVRDADAAEGRLPVEGSPSSRFGFYVEPGEAPPAFSMVSTSGEKSPAPAVYHLLVDSASLEGDPPQLGGDLTLYRPAVFVAGGEVFDVRVRHQGQSTLQSSKKSWKVNFFKDHRFRTLFADHPEVDTINLSACYSDRSFLRQWLSFKAFYDAGEPSLEAWHVRLYLNGKYRGLYLHLESPNEKQWLQRVGLDSSGWLWKAYSDARHGANGFELKVDGTRNPIAASAELEHFLVDMNELEGEALSQAIRLRLDVASYTTYLALIQLLHDCDSAGNNYLVYTDPKSASRYYHFLPWDKDLTHGRNYECVATESGDPGVIVSGDAGIYSETLRFDMFGDPGLLFGTSARPRCLGIWNGMVNAFLQRTESFRAPFHERVRELLDTLYDPAVLDPQIDELAAALSSEAERDWNLNPPYGPRVPYSVHVAALKEYVARRHAYLSASLTALGAPEIADLACEKDGAMIRLAWTGGGAESSIRVYRNGSLAQTLPGSATSTVIALAQLPTTFRIAPVVQSVERAGLECSVLSSAAEPVRAEFEGSPRLGPAPLSVSFTNMSEGGTAYLWRFGDGATSIETNPTHIYAQPGAYTVKLQASGPGGVSQRARAAYVIATEKVEARFSAPETVGRAPLSVAFSNRSAGASEYAWDFGDGSVSGESSPAHVYRFGGEYTVQLTARAPDGSESVATRPAFVQVDGDLAATFFVTPSYGPPPLRVGFRDESVGGARSWLWDFGDGETSREKDPEHVYAAQGAYTVTLEVFGFAASASVTKASLVTVGYGPPFLRGDVTSDGRIDISDAIAILTYLYLGGLRISCLEAADVDDQGTVNVTDAVRLLSSLFTGGGPPFPPYPEPGVDPTPGGVGCEGTDRRSTPGQNRVRQAACQRGPARAPSITPGERQEPARARRVDRAYT
jgi:PKD repeat protein